jgi:hypothetical protein
MRGLAIGLSSVLLCPQPMNAMTNYRLSGRLANGANVEREKSYQGTYTVLDDL